MFLQHSSPQSIRCDVAVRQETWYLGENEPHSFSPQHCTVRWRTLGLTLSNHVGFALWASGSGSTTANVCPSLVHAHAMPFLPPCSVLQLGMILIFFHSIILAFASTTSIEPIKKYTIVLRIPILPKQENKTGCVLVRGDTSPLVSTVAITFRCLTPTAGAAWAVKALTTAVHTYLVGVPSSPPLSRTRPSPRPRRNKPLRC